MEEFIRSRDSRPDPAAFGALLLRLALGAIFVAHAMTKLLVLTLPGTAEFFAAHGFPAWTAYPVFALELLGGAALLVGWHTRWVSAALVPVMLGALAVHWENGWSFTAPNGGWEYVAFIVTALLAQACLGDGAFALGRATAARPRNTDAWPHRGVPNGSCCGAARAESSAPVRR